MITPFFILFWIILWATIGFAFTGHLYAQTGRNRDQGQWIGLLVGSIGNVLALPIFWYFVVLFPAEATIEEEVNTPLTPVAPCWNLQVQNQQNSSQQIPLPNKGLWVGRSHQCQLPLPNDATVSRCHCWIGTIQGRLYVYDAKSSNGSFWNGMKVRWARLRQGDSIQIGKTKLKVVSRTC